MNRSDLTDVVDRVTAATGSLVDLVISGAAESVRLARRDAVGVDRCTAEYLAQPEGWPGWRPPLAARSYARAVLWALEPGLQIDQAAADPAGLVARHTRALMGRDARSLRGVEKWVRQPYLADNPRQLTGPESRAWRQETAARATLWLNHLFRAVGSPPPAGTTFSDISNWWHPAGSVSVASTVDAFRVDPDGQIIEIVLVTTDEPAQVSAAFESLAVFLGTSQLPGLVRVMDRRTARIAEFVVDRGLVEAGVGHLEVSTVARRRRLEGECFDAAATRPGRHCRFCPALEICNAGEAWLGERAKRMGPLALIPLNSH